MGEKKLREGRRRLREHFLHLSTLDRRLIGGEEGFSVVSGSKQGFHAEKGMRRVWYLHENHIIEGMNSVARLLCL